MVCPISCHVVNLISFDLLWVMASVEHMISSLSHQSTLIVVLIIPPNRPNFLIFDEPTNHLDVETVEALGKAFAKFKVKPVIWWQPRQE